MPSIIEMLTSSDPQEAKQALLALGASDDPAAFSAITVGLIHPHREVAALAHQILEDCKNEALIDGLIRACREEESELRFFMVMALGYTKSPKAGPALAELLQSEDVELRRAAATGLLHLGDAAVVPALIEATTEADAQAQRAILLALATTNPRQAVEPITKLLVHEGIGVRQRAVGALQAVTRDIAASLIAPSLRADDQSVRLAAAWALTECNSEEAVKALTETLQEASDPLLRYVALIGLGEAGAKSAIPALVTALDDPDPLVRHYAAVTLGHTEDAEAVPPLAAALDDAHADVRFAAAWALGNIGSDEGLSSLSSAAKSDTEALVRTEAVRALGRLGSKALSALAEALHDKAPEVRKEAAWALGEIEDRKALPALAGAMSDGDAEVRVAALYASAGIGGKRSIPALAEALSDESADVRCAAASALGDIGGSKALAPLKKARKDRDESVREAVEDALSRCRSEKASPK